MTRKGFTSTEITVAIALILLLAALLLRVFSRVREQSRKTVCASSLRQIGVAFLQYSQDHGENLPLDDELSSVQPYIRNTEVLICPGDLGTGPYGTTPLYKCDNGSSYRFNHGVQELSVGNYWLLPRHSEPPKGVSGMNITQVQSANRVVMVSEKSAVVPFSWHDGPVDNNGHQNARSHICFVDGHVKYVNVYLDDADFPPFTYDHAICYDPPGTSTRNSTYEYQWSATP